MTTIKEIERIFNKHDGVMRTREVTEYGIHYKMLQKLIEEGYVEKVRYGYYQWQDAQVFSEASIITALFPEGILCMNTALLYYDYTDRTPAAWHIAVDNTSSRSRFKLDYPSIRPHYIQKNRLELGMDKGDIDGITVRIYNRERVICDCLRHVNKMDREIFNSAIKSYINDSDKNISRLMTYAKALGVEKKVRMTMGVWL